ncbi:MAG TPA: hypothetical protein VL966_19515 [Alphaproteobacteria bacterium]|nr:hypothetical protein [Alphaproteobacteria bacterium]
MVEKSGKPKLELTEADLAAGILGDPYVEWAAGEGVPVHEDFGLDLLALDVKPWSRFGIPGCIAHVKGRSDFLTLFVLEIPPGGRTAPMRHLFETVAYGLSGSGTTVVRIGMDREQAFEWGEKSVFAIPLNAPYQLFNASGRSPARVVLACSLPAVFNMFRNEEFVFRNDARFPEREGVGHFSGDGDFVSVRSGRHMWETNFIPDVGALRLESYEGRGAGGTNIKLVLADGTIHAHVSEMPVGTYKKGHRHGPDVHVFCVSGSGYSLLWYEGDADFVRVDWRHGVVYAPPDGMFHQHFATSRDSARYLAIGFGSILYPYTNQMRKIFLGSDVDVKLGGNQIEYEDQDPRIHQIYLAELAKTGAQSAMEAFIDESHDRSKFKSAR